MSRTPMMACTYWLGAFGFMRCNDVGIRGWPLEPVKSMLTARLICHPLDRYDVKGGCSTACTLPTWMSPKNSFSFPFFKHQAERRPTRRHASTRDGRALQFSYRATEGP